jgi:hypothetical protein
MGRVVLASLMLPGLRAVSHTVQAEEGSERAALSVKLGDYRDGQPGWDRIRVLAPHVGLSLPLSQAWVLDAGWVGDSVSGATPRMHTSQTGASRMSDDRKALDAKLTRRFNRASVAVGVAVSDEHDYTSKALSLEGRWSSDDNNRTWVLGASQSADAINTVTGAAANQHRNTTELMGGITQVLTPTDIAQLNLTHASGSGYYDDPYKLFDKRPGSRNTDIALLRWNHFVQGPGASLRSSWRLYRDSFGVRSHTLSTEWAQPMGRWTLTPGARYYTQSAARFYLPNTALTAQGEPDLAAVVPLAMAQPYYSLDQRLSAFGALTASIKVAYAWDADTTIDAKLEQYAQRSSWRLGGHGSPNLAPFNARFVQLGLTRQF